MPSNDYRTTRAAVLVMAYAAARYHDERIYPWYGEDDGFPDALDVSRIFVDLAFNELTEHGLLTKWEQASNGNVDRTEYTVTARCSITMEKFLNDYNILLPSTRRPRSMVEAVDVENLEAIFGLD
jgi:hypothetical protein